MNSSIRWLVIIQVIVASIGALAPTSQLAQTTKVTKKASCCSVNICRRCRWAHIISGVFGRRCRLYHFAKILYLPRMGKKPIEDTTELSLEEIGGMPLEIAREKNYNILVLPPVLPSDGEPDDKLLKKCQPKDVEIRDGVFVKVHSGLWEYAEMVVNKIGPYEQELKSKKLLILGHSLGASLAPLIALKLKMLGWDLKKVSVLGIAGLRVMDKEAARWMNEDLSQYIQIDCANDIRPVLPLTKELKAEMDQNIDKELDQRKEERRRSSTIGKISDGLRRRLSGLAGPKKPRKSSEDPESPADLGSPGSSEEDKDWSELQPQESEEEGEESEDSEPEEEKYKGMTEKQIKKEKEKQKKWKERNKKAYIKHELELLEQKDIITEEEIYYPAQQIGIIVDRCGESRINRGPEQCDNHTRERIQELKRKVELEKGYGSGNNPHYLWEILGLLCLKKKRIDLSRTGIDEVLDAFEEKLASEPPRRYYPEINRVALSA